jgi:bacteriocin-like protein
MSEHETEKKDEELSDEELDKVSGGKGVAMPRPPLQVQAPIAKPGSPVTKPGGGPISQ